jgi:hypothetical protein
VDFGGWGHNGTFVGQIVGEIFQVARLSRLQARLSSLEARFGCFLFEKMVLINFFCRY